MAAKNTQKLCFVIAPIGEEGSEVRIRSDQILKHVIAPAAEECGYKTIRADKIAEPGIIASHVIQHLVDDNLVVADLTGRNPNVFYELAVRHAVRKPVVQLIQTGETIPFDVAGTRTIQVDHHDLDSVAQCRQDLVKQVRSVEANLGQVDSPISVAIDLQSLRQSENPLEKSNAEIISMLQELRSTIGELTTPTRLRMRVEGLLAERLLRLFRHIHDLSTLEKGQRPTLAKFHQIRSASDDGMKTLTASGARESFMYRSLLGHSLLDSEIKGHISGG